MTMIQNFDFIFYMKYQSIFLIFVIGLSVFMPVGRVKTYANAISVVISEISFREEVVEIQNISEQTIDLSGWKIKSNENTTFLKGNLDAQNFMVVSLEINANTQNETIILYDTEGNMQDTISYDRDLKTDKNYTRFINNLWYPQDSTWLWSESSLGMENGEKYIALEAFPNSGYFENSIQVELKTNTNQAKIFYTFDENAPEEEYKLYDGPINIAQSEFLYFFALENDQKIETKQTWYTIGKTHENIPEEKTVSKYEVTEQYSKIIIFSVIKSLVSLFGL